MEDNKLLERQRLTSLALSVHIAQLCSLTDEYLKKFDRKDFFVLSSTEEQNKLFRKEYYSFISKLPEVVDSADDSVADLSELMTLADEQGRIDLITLIGAKTEAYMTFLASLDKFARESKAIISADSISPSRLISCTRTFKACAEALIETLSE